MNEKFSYGYDVNAYLDKAFSQMKELYPWATKEMLGNKWSYAIEKGEDGKHSFVSYYKWDDGEIEREVMVCDGDKFIRLIIDRHRDGIERENPVKDTLKMSLPGGLMVRGWYVERYEFRSHVLGGYSVLVQAGNRSAGGTRTIFIPPSYFELSWPDFLDKYMELVPSNAFGLERDFLDHAAGLKTFLGY